ncbi:hypothetical protein [Amycolatopsis silviterrae]|uniref:Serine/threonine protein kinase n=1 Tax=Amycolatopsis silviterrae TaxID=1656914 RepID=A0ABW5H2A0_9PSEU
MLRLAERRLPAPADRASGELVDRTGIIAASLPRGPRPQDDAVVPETSCESTQQIPVIAGCAPAEERPRAVASRRRARVWVGTGVAVVLVGLGWLAGGYFTGALGPSSDDAVAQAEQRTPIAEQQIPVPSTITPPSTQTAPPVTVYVPVPSRETPVRRHAPVHPTTPRATAAPKTSEQADPRADLETPTPSKTPPRAGIDEFLNWKPWFDVAQRMAGGH